SPANFKDSTAFSARCAPHLRRCGGGRRPRRCAHGAPLFVWIPAYVGTTTYLSPAKFKESTAFSWRCATHLRRSGGGRSPGRCAYGAPLSVWIPAYAGTTMLLSLAKFKERGFFVAMCYPPSSLRRRPESRPLRAWRAAFCLDPGLRRDDDVVASRHIQGRIAIAMMRYPH